MAELNVRIKMRSKAAAEWTAEDVLLKGELGFDTTNKLFKLGDGTTAWKNLDYAVNEASIITSNTKSGWSSSNPVLGKNEIGLEYASTVGSGEVNIKVGDGTKAWNSLGYSFNNDITNKPIKSITTSSAENPSLAANDTLAVVAGKLNKQQSFLKTKLGYERLNSLASALGGLSNNDFVGAMEKLNSLKFNKTSVYNGTDSSSTSLAASANVARSLKSSIDTLNQKWNLDANTSYVSMGKASDGNSYVSFYDKENHHFQFIFNDTGIRFGKDDGSGYKVVWNINSQ